MNASANLSRYATILLLGSLVLCATAADTSRPKPADVESLRGSKSTAPQLTTAVHPPIDQIHPLSLFRIDGMSRTLTEPGHVRLQVQYWISAAAKGAYFLGAKVDGKDVCGFKFTPAGRLPDGIRKGQVAFTDDVAVELWYEGATPYTSQKTEVFIYDASGKTVASSTLKWGQTWQASSAAVSGCKVEGIKQLTPPPGSTAPSQKVAFAVQYTIPANYPKACFISALVPNATGYFGYKPAGLLPAGVPKGQHFVAEKVIVEVVYTGSSPRTSDSIEFFIYDADKKELTREKLPFRHTWSTAPVANPPALAGCEVQGIKQIAPSPQSNSASKNVTFAVQYVVPGNHPNACFIGCEVPDNRCAFAYTPAGLLPTGVPKGQHGFSDNVTFELTYLGTGTYDSNSLDVKIYDSAKRELARARLPFSHRWTATGP